MAKTAHTPGPWEVRDYRTKENAIWIDCAAGGTLAEVYASGTGSDDPRVQDANARLIAAAPELLNALTKAVQAHGPFGDDTRPDWFNEACAAIAKAEG